MEQQIVVTYTMNSLKLELNDYWLKNGWVLVPGSIGCGTTKKKDTSHSI